MSNKLLLTQLPSNVKHELYKAIKTYHRSRMCNKLAHKITKKSMKILRKYYSESISSDLTRQLLKVIENDAKQRDNEDNIKKHMQEMQKRKESIQKKEIIRPMPKKIVTPQEHRNIQEAERRLNKNGTG